MFRHRISLNPTNCIPAKSLLENLDAPWPDNSEHQVVISHPLGHIGRFRIAVSGDTLEIAGAVTEPPGWSFTPRQPYAHWFSNDHVMRLATLDEMREDIRIQQRMWLLAYNHGHEFFYKVYNQEKVPWDEGPTVFPPE